MAIGVYPLVGMALCMSSTAATEAGGPVLAPALRQGTIAKSAGLDYRALTVMIQDKPMLRFATLALAAAALSIPAMVPAQIKGSQQSTGQSTPEEQRRTQDLNRQQADAARAQADANIRSQQQFQTQMEEYQAANAAVSAARAAYEAELEANRQARAAYDAAYARWQADVAACSAGDYARCQSAPPAPK